MNPDPNEPTSADNELPYGHDGGAEEVYPGGENAAYPEQTSHYDPGAAFLDENLQYGAADAQTADPEQAYYDPGQAYAEPDQAYVDPNQAYYDPGQAYADPGQTYADPGQTYADPGQAYVESGQEYYGGGQETEASGGVYDEGVAPAPVRPSSASSRSQKKKVGRRVPKASPLVRKRGSAGSKYRRPVQSGGGISLMSVLVTLLALAMLAGVVMMILPADISKIAGYPASPIPVPKPRNILDEAQTTMMERKELLTLSEEAVNQYLSSRLQGTQKGALAALVKFKGVYVDFSPGVAEIFVEREIFGKTLTMSSRVTAERGRKGMRYQPVGWTLGRVDLGKRSVKPVVQLFLRLRSTCLEEFQALEQMSEVIFEENTVVLNPVFK